MIAGFPAVVPSGRTVAGFSSRLVEGSRQLQEVLDHFLQRFHPNPDVILYFFSVDGLTWFMDCEDPEALLVASFALPVLYVGVAFPHVGGLLTGIRIAFEVRVLTFGGPQDGRLSAQALMYFPGVGWPIRRDLLAFAQDSASPLKDLCGRHDFDATDLEGGSVACHGVSIHVPAVRGRSPCGYDYVTVSNVRLTGPAQLGKLDPCRLGLLILAVEVKLFSPLMDRLLGKIYGPLAHSVLLIGFSGFLLWSITIPVARPRNLGISLQTGAFYRAVAFSRDPARCARLLSVYGLTGQWVKVDAQGHPLRVSNQRVTVARRAAPAIALQVARGGKGGERLLHGAGLGSFYREVASLESRLSLLLG